MFKWRSEPIPNLDEPEKWFEYADKNKDNELSVEETITAMINCCKPSNTNQRLFLRNKIQDKWIEQCLSTNLIELNRDQFICGGMAKFLDDVEQEFKFKYNGICSEKKLILGRHIGKLRDISADPKKWFEFYDSDKSQTLSREEITFALFDLLSPRNEKEEMFICEIVGGMFNVFDIDHTATIDKWEFLVKGGMADCIVLLEKNWKDHEFKEKLNTEYLDMRIKQTRRHACSPPPSISSNPQNWFDHFDVDHSKDLSQKEVICGLYVTLNAVTSEERCKIRQFIVIEWSKKCIQTKVTKEDFIKSGLAISLQKFEREWRKVTSTCETSYENIKIKVFIPENYQPGDIITISSPLCNNEALVVMTPEKYVWGGGKNEPFYFYVKF